MSIPVDVLRQELQFSWQDSGQDFQVPLYWWKNRYRSDLPPRSYVWIVHGIGEHAARYDELASFLAQMGFDVLAIDLPGHGRARHSAFGGEKRLRSFKHCRAVLNRAIEYWVSEGPRAAAGAGRKDWYLLAHSLGALISLSWMIKAREEGLSLPFAQAAFLSAPPLRLRMPVPQWKKSLAERVVTLRPHLEMGNEIAVEDLSYESANRAAYREDQDVHPYASPELFLSMLKEADEVRSRCRDIEIPLTLAVGEDDPIVDPSAIEDLYQLLGTHKRFARIEGSRHEIFNDVHKRALFHQVVEWFL